MDASNFNGEDLKKKFTDATGKIKDDLGAIADGLNFEDVTKAGGELIDEAAGFVKKYPVAAAAAAFVAGTLVGNMLGRKR